VRSFLITKYAEAIDMLGFKADEVPDTFDFLLNGVIDSFGILEMIAQWKMSYTSSWISRP
jgi:hypothetical protein